MAFLRVCKGPGKEFGGRVHMARGLGLGFWGVCRPRYVRGFRGLGFEGLVLYVNPYISIVQQPLYRHVALYCRSSFE